MKKTVSFLLMIGLLLNCFCCSFAESSSTQQYVFGDVNFDNQINAKDALDILKYSVSKIELTTEQKTCADVDGNSGINAKDALEVLKFSVNKIDKFPVELLPPEHNIIEHITPPTCTKDGYTTYICTDCDYFYTDKEVSATGHSWGSWVTVTAADVGKTGQEKRICSTCKTSETRTIPALQEDTTKKWFVNQYAIAKQQYINSLNSSISTKQAKIDDLRDDASALYVNYMKEVQRIREKYAGSAGTLERALRDAQLNYNNSAQVYTNQIKSLESEIADIKTEIEKPNVDNILAIVTKNCNISSRETYEYYNKYSDSLS